MSKAKFKEGFVARPHGPSSKITNKELTNEIAVYLLESGDAKESDFDVLPEGWGKEKATNDDGKGTGTQNTPVVRTPDEIAAALKAFDVKSEKAYEDAKQLVKELKLAPKSNKKQDVFEVVLAAQKAAEAPAQTQE